jgi:hypothetical protein
VLKILKEKKLLSVCLIFSQLYFITFLKREDNMTSSEFKFKSFFICITCAYLELKIFMEFINPKTNLGDFIMVVKDIQIYILFKII